MEAKSSTLQKRVLAIVLFFGFLLRFWNLGSNALSVRHDEPWRALIVSSNDWFGSLLHNVYAPLTPGFIAIPHYLVRFFGNTEFVLRFSVALCSALSLILLYLIVKSLYNETAATIAVFLLSPFSLLKQSDQGGKYILCWRGGDLKQEGGK
jgi:4-amino-4-deoxy-L-arabinose transferase-like glycosyltransferase